MSTGPAVNTDTRMIAAGLAANVAIVRPYIITATGRAAPSRNAIVTADACASFALLPHVDYIDDPDRRPGCGFIGGRISSVAPLLATGAIPPHVAIKLRTLPESGESILHELRSRAGLSSAPGALFARAAWTDTFVATYFDRLRQNGDEAQLNVAHAQGSLALRKAWQAVEWGIGLLPNTALITASGVVAVGRALIDVIALVDRLAAPRCSGLTRPAHRETALAALLTALAHFVRHVQAAEATNDPLVATRKLSLALDWARKILDATGVFAVATDAERKRWQRLTNMLDIGKLYDHAGGAATKLDRFSRALEQLQCADLGHRLECTGWRPHVRRSLLRLSLSDRQARLALLNRIRCDLIFALAATRQLDRLYRLFPWLAAIHGAFPGCAGGALGALASLYEAARGMEIGQDMTRRLADMGHRPGTVARLGVREARAVYVNPRHTVLALGRNYAAGAALVAQVTSHVMVRAALHGKKLGGNLSLEAVRRGRLDYNDPAALKIKRTRDAVVTIQQAQPAFRVNSPDNDLVRHMGLTLVRHVAALVYAIWPTRSQREDFAIHRMLIHTGKRLPKGSDLRPKDIGPWANSSKYRIHHEIMRSMLRAIDCASDTDDMCRDAILDFEAPPAHGRESSRAGQLREKPSRKTGAWEEHDEGQSAARDAGREPTVSDERGAILRDLVNDAGRWRPLDPRKPQPAPEDDLLEDILLGRANLAQLAPVSDLFIPILWFAPLIDRDRLAWIARGMPGQAVGDDDAPHAARLKSWLSAVRRWSSAPFANSIVRGRDDAIACHLFTGVSSVTADWGHVR
ncbi:hypothetical protein EJC47_00730 [Sphingomonas sp. TF3]|uniref:hypothetical protein n=1 Tax=Sphingomonas sp. TF3 TaxID=2495580 RepID=UPI000F87A9EE|nr:hypothetical protein [Sphingomonas sp. TF3]RUN78434.1 hypothetical protein EJC47_00730 [Sphingomonas sp. TF3]